MMSCGDNSFPRFLSFSSRHCPPPDWPTAHTHTHTQMYDTPVGQDTQNASWHGAARGNATSTTAAPPSCFAHSRLQPAAPAVEHRTALSYPYSHNTLTNSYLSQRSTAQPPPTETTAATETCFSDPCAVIARHKARYARNYTPPVALRYSQLSPAADTHTRKSQRPWGSSDAARSVGCAPPAAPPSQQTHAFVRQPPQGAANAPNSQEWRSFLLSLHERQLACWRQLSGEVQALQAEMRGIRDELRERGVKGTSLPSAANPAEAVPSSSQGKRPRGQADAAHIGNAARTARRTGGVQPHCMAVNSVRLLGASCASTPAQNNEDEALSEKERQRGEGCPAASATGEADDGAGDEVSERADSEADLFLL